MPQQALAAARSGKPPAHTQHASPVLAATAVKPLTEAEEPLVAAVEEAAGSRFAMLIVAVVDIVAAAAVATEGVVEVRSFAAG